MDDEKKYSLKDIYEYCLKYDTEQGMYPEHEYEGRAFFKSFICDNNIDISTDGLFDNKEIYE